jgi:D-alanyl-D-alanine carboxypeptidase
VKKHVLGFIESQKNFIALLALAALCLLSYVGYSYYTLSLEFKMAQEQFTLTQAQSESEMNVLKETLAHTQNESAKLSNALGEEKVRNDMFDSQIQSITGALGTLDKLSKTDSELLEKYSKVYFLNENYIPESLADVNKQFLYESERKTQFHAKALFYLQALVSSASEHNASLLVISAYRSFGDQASLKANYKITYGTGANQFSADQGYSEHQLGTAVDFTTPAMGASFNGFEATLAYTWLTQNAHKYGFTLSYPKNNGYYQFEPWHWRFIGVELATKLFNDGKHFYDIDQREIDSYLVSIFN